MNSFHADLDGSSYWDWDIDDMSDKELLALEEQFAM